MNLYKFFEEGWEDVKKDSPLILTGLACAGVVATSVISIFAGKKLQKKDEIVIKKIEEKKAAGEILTKKQTVILHVREKWPALAPVVIAVGVTCFCAIKSYKISAKRIAGLTVALTATTKAFDGYKKAAEKILGEKEKEIEREKMRNEILENPAKPEDEKKFLETQKHNYENNIYNGPMAFFEPLTQQPIFCSESDVVRAFEEVNFRLKSGQENFVSVADFLYCLSKYAQNDIKYDEKSYPQAQEAGWLYDQCKYHGIDYSNKFDEGVRIGAQFYAKIRYKAYWQASENEINFLY